MGGGGGGGVEGRVGADVGSLNRNNKTEASCSELTHQIQSYVYRPQNLKFKL